MNKIRRIGTTLLIVAALGSVVGVARSQAVETTVLVKPHITEVVAGRSARLAVQVQGVEDLGAFQFDLTYDPEIVHVDSITLGDFPGSTGRAVNPLGPKIQAGTAVYGAFSFGDVAGPTGSGTLAIVTLEAQAAGQSPLGLQSVQLIDTSGSTMSVATEGGTVVVTQAGTPRASTPALSDVGTPTSVATATASIGFPEPQTSTTEEPPLGERPPIVQWAITGGVLSLIAAIAVLLARNMAR